MRRIFGVFCKVGYVLASFRHAGDETSLTIYHQRQKRESNCYLRPYPDVICTSPGWKSSETNHPPTHMHARAPLLASANPMLTHFKQEVGLVWQQPVFRITAVMSCAPSGASVSFWSSQPIEDVGFCNSQSESGRRLHLCIYPAQTL